MNLQLAIRRDVDLASKVAALSGPLPKVATQGMWASEQNSGKRMWSGGGGYVRKERKFLAQ